MKNDLKPGEQVVFNASCNTKADKIYKGDKATIINIASKKGIPAIELKEYPGAIFSPSLFIYNLSENVLILR